MIALLNDAIGLLANDLPAGSAVGMGSAIGTGGALIWLLAKTLPDRERTMREIARAHREGLHELAVSIDGLRDGMVSQLSDGNQHVIELLTTLACLSREQTEEKKKA